jgi:hypothetical protein
VTYPLHVNHAAEAAGLLKGDLIVTIDGKRPSSLGGIRKMLLGPKGARVEIGIKRGGSLLGVEVERGGGSMSQAPLLGIGMGFKHALNGGYIVTNIQPGGPAERAGVLSDDLICLYNGENVTVRPGSYLNEMLSNDTDPIVRFGVRRGDAANLISVVVVRTPLNVSNRDHSVLPSAAASRGPRSTVGAAPGLGGGAGTYSSGYNGIREYFGSVPEYISSYDSEKSDNYTSGGGSYSSQRGSFVSDSSREEYSSDDRSVSLESEMVISTIIYA